MNLLAALAASVALAAPTGVADTKRAICVTFGRYCSQALRVAYCETGGSYSVYARNGQYLGLFQMGAYARATLRALVERVGAVARRLPVLPRVGLLVAAVDVQAMRSLLLALALTVGALSCLIGLLAVCIRVAGTPDAWKVAVLVLVAAPLFAFAARERR